MKIGIIGTGAYGLSLAIAFSENNCDITMWTKNDKEYEFCQKNYNKINKNF